MTIDEAIKNREGCLKYLEGIGPKASPECLEAVRWSVKALKALRPVSREQVEKVWKGGQEKDVTMRYICKLCGCVTIEEIDFCPYCGAAHTDKAVEIVMERLEELYNA